MTSSSNNSQLADVVEGLVESTNDRGVKVGGEWRNLSEFHPLEEKVAERRPVLDLIREADGSMRWERSHNHRPVLTAADYDRCHHEETF
jgi:hypothetical protein